MAKTKISEFSATPGNNTDIDSINIAEGCAPSGINDAIRELMAQLKDWQSGTSNDPMVIGSTGSLTLSYGTANGVPYLNGSKVLTSGSALVFDGANLGVGVTPSAWGTGIALQGDGGSVWFRGVAGGLNSVYNYAFTASANRYIANGYASRYTQVDGQHLWYTAPSGTAGAAITFTQAMTLDANGNLGIGTDIPASIVAGTANTAIVTIGGGDGSLTTGDRAGTLSFKSDDASYKGTFADGIVAEVCAITNSATGAAYDLAFYTGSTAGRGERARIDSSGYLRMASGSLGIQFNGDTAAANALDDYEEGTFTPTIVGATTAGTGTYSVQVGRYTKIGDRVYFNASVTWSAHTGTGSMKLGALPFATLNIANNVQACAIESSSLTFSGQLTANVDNNAATVSIQSTATGAVIAGVPIDTAATVYISGHYEV